MPNKKRKSGSGNVNFSRNKAPCLVYKEMVEVMKYYNLKQHDTKHTSE